MEKESPRNAPEKGIKKTQIVASRPDSGFSDRQTPAPSDDAVASSSSASAAVEGPRASPAVGFRPPGNHVSHFKIEKSERER